MLSLASYLADLFSRVDLAGDIFEYKVKTRSVACVVVDELYDAL